MSTLKDIIDKASTSMLCEERKLGLLFESLARAADPETMNFAEFGVFRGGSAVILAHVLKIRQPRARLHLFDSWEGFPATHSKDSSHLCRRMLASPKTEAVETLKKYNLLEQCVFHDGFFFQTLQKFDRQLMFAHVDCDLYQSTKEVLTKVFKLLNPRGSIIVDDYSPRFDGVREAVNEMIPPGWKIHIQNGTPDTAALITRSNL